MSAEHALSTSTELVPWSESTARLRLIGGGLGKHALLFEGFEPMDQVESPYAAVRARLETKIIDQNPAIDAIIDALESFEARLPNDMRPIANLAFLGPTGVGKSETAKTLSQALGENHTNIIKIDCSDYSHGHEVSTLTGAPPSFVGYDQPPLLSKERVEQKGTVVLFDEIEKGSVKLYNLMLQIMGDGTLQLKNGDTVSFRDTIVIMTSNLGARDMFKNSTTPFGLSASQKREASKDELDKIAGKAFKDFFAPEFVNRLNKMVVFHQLTPDGLGRVLDEKLDTANAVYEQQYGIRLSLSETTRQHLIGIALQEPHNGARPLVRALEDNIQKMLGRYIGGNYVQEGTHIKVFHTSETPQSYVPNDDSPLIFTAKVDHSIKKHTEPEDNSAHTPINYALELPAADDKRMN